MCEPAFSVMILTEIEFSSGSTWMLEPFPCLPLPMVLGRCKKKKKKKRRRKNRISLHLRLCSHSKILFLISWNWELGLQKEHFTRADRGIFNEGAQTLFKSKKSGSVWTPTHSRHPVSAKNKGTCPCFCKNKGRVPTHPHICPCSVIWRVGPKWRDDFIEIPMHAAFD